MAMGESQGGSMLVEVMVSLALSTLVLVPFFAWALLSLRQEADSRNTNSDSFSLGWPTCTSHAMWRTRRLAPAPPPRMDRPDPPAHSWTASEVREREAMCASRSSHPVTDGSSIQSPVGVGRKGCHCGDVSARIGPGRPMRRCRTQH